MVACFCHVISSSLGTFECRVVDGMGFADGPDVTDVVAMTPSLWRSGPSQLVPKLLVGNQHWVVLLSKCKKGVGRECTRPSPHWIKRRLGSSSPLAFLASVAVL